MVELLRHRQTKGAATDMFYLTPPRHISTLPQGGHSAIRSSQEARLHHSGVGPLSVCALSKFLCQAVLALTGYKSRANSYQAKSSQRLKARSYRFDDGS
jgi:hypothetical protein